MYILFNRVFILSNLAFVSRWLQAPRISVIETPVNRDYLPGLNIARNPLATLKNVFKFVLSYCLFLKSAFYSCSIFIRGYDYFM